MSMDGQCDPGPSRWVTAVITQTEALRLRAICPVPLAPRVLAGSRHEEGESSCFCVTLPPSSLGSWCL